MKGEKGSDGDVSGRGIRNHHNRGKIFEQLKKDVLWREIFRLPEKDRMVLYLHYMKKYSPEIAELLKISYHTVCVRLNRAKKRLARFIPNYRKNRFLEVLLPSFGLGEYEYRQGADYIGKMIPDGVFINAEMWKGDSCYMFTISRFSDATSVVFTNKIYNHYEVPINVITYEVLQLTQDYTYEEFRSI